MDFDLAENHLAAEANSEVSKKKKKRANQEKRKRTDGQSLLLRCVDASKYRIFHSYQ